MDKRRYPRQAYNFISLGGIGVALFGFASIIILYLLSLFSGGENPYLGIFIFLVFPGIMVFGLLLIPFGMWRERRRLVEGKTRPLVVDLGVSHHRNMILAFIVVTSVFLLITTVGLYEGYHYTESVEFCGKVCHNVMAPEHTAYFNSAHAKVGCVKCHIGPGAGWYVKSKMSGARQVFKAALGIYPRPIHTPIIDLRPAQEVCEQCHWPQKFFPATQVTRDYFLGDRDNTHWQIKLLINVGGSSEGTHSGIHWHVAEDNSMTYVSSDSSRQDFDLVSWRSGGEEVVYTKGGVPMPDSVLARARTKGFERTLDCIDCHNRPSHSYRSPMKAVNAALASGKLSSSLPWIKREAVKALSVEYETEEGARDSIALAIEGFYAEKGIDLDPGAVETVQELHRQNMFPHMRARWDKYPENRSHFFFKGCFRCHGSSLQTEDGKTISDDCSLCHTIIHQGPDAVADTVVFSGLEFQHPIDIDGSEKKMHCYDCHIGDESIYLNIPDEES
jgi:hypothetical protein